MNCVNSEQITFVNEIVVQQLRLNVFAKYSLFSTNPFALFLYSSYKIEVHIFDKYKYKNILHYPVVFYTHRRRIY